MSPSDRVLMVLIIGTMVFTIMYWITPNTATFGRMLLGVVVSGVVLMIRDYVKNI